VIYHNTRETNAMPTTWLRRTLPAFFLVLPLGCGDSAPTLVQVSGKVSYRKLPLQNGTIVFTPDPRKGSSGSMAMGEIRTDGIYSLQTGKAFGAAPGHYRITVAAVLGSPPSPGQPYHYQPSLLPEKYRDPELSGLECEIKTGLAQAVDFDLN
jgi:hypothetical protein